LNTAHKEETSPLHRSKSYEVNPSGFFILRANAIDFTVIGLAIYFGRAVANGFLFLVRSVLPNTTHNWLANGLATYQITQQPAEMASSQVFIAIDTSKLGNASSISATIEAIVQDYKTSIPIHDQGKISYPSERVLATRLKNSQAGIPVLENVWQEVLGFLE
jgi:hypothetical protein